MGAQFGEALLDVRLHRVLEVDDPEDALVLGNRERACLRCARCRSTAAAELRRATAGCQADEGEHGIDRSLAQLAAARQGRLPEMRVWAVNGITLVEPPPSRDAVSGEAVARSWPGPRWRGPSGVSSARLANSTASASALLRHVPPTGTNSLGMRLPKVIVPVLSSSSVSTSPAASTSASGGRHDVEADQPVHPGDADGREQATDGRRDEADEQRHQHSHRQASRPNRAAMRPQRSRRRSGR